MKPTDRTKKLILVAFILSLLFHVTSILYLLQQGSNTHPTQSLQEQEELKQKIKREEQWAETKARASNFGAPVMFKDTHDDEQSEPETKKGETTQQEQPEQKTPELEQHIDIPKPEKITPPMKTQQETTTIEPPQKVNPQKKQQPPSRAQRTAPQPVQRQLSAPSPKQIPSLAQLTQGFLDHVKDEGKHAIHMLGNKNSLPSDEQIKHERYLQKISWCLQNSFNINNDRFPASGHTEQTVHIILALNRDGTMKQCSVAKTSGNIHLDNFTLFIFNDASTSFPPVPQYLPYDPFTVRYIIALNSTEQNNMRIYRR